MRERLRDPVSLAPSNVMSDPMLHDVRGKNGDGLAENGTNLGKENGRLVEYVPGIGPKGPANGRLNPPTPGIRYPTPT